MKPHFFAYIKWKFLLWKSVRNCEIKTTLPNFVAAAMLQLILCAKAFNSSFIQLTIYLSIFEREWLQFFCIIRFTTENFGQFKAKIIVEVMKMHPIFNFYGFALCLCTHKCLFRVALLDNFIPKNFFISLIK